MEGSNINHSDALKIVSKDRDVHDSKIGPASRDKMLRALHVHANDFIFESLKTASHLPTNEEVIKIRTIMREKVPLEGGKTMTEVEIDYALSFARLATLPNHVPSSDRHKLFESLKLVREDMVIKNRKAPISRIFRIKEGSTNKDLDYIENEMIRILGIDSLEKLMVRSEYMFGSAVIRRFRYL